MKLRTTANYRGILKRKRELKMTQLTMNISDIELYEFSSHTRYSSTQKRLKYPDVFRLSSCSSKSIIAVNREKITISTQRYLNIMANNH